MNAPHWTMRLYLSAFFLAASSPAFALANRVFVSARSGNNANACDNILTPCQTFAGAVLQLNPGGEAIVLDSGGYGPVTITQALTLEAPPGVLAFIHPPSGDAITVNAGTGNVVLRGLVLNGGSGAGIIVSSVGSLHVENCVISGFATDGIFANAASSSVFIKDTISRQNGGNGLDVPNGRASVDHCRFEGNAEYGVFVDGADVTIRDSVIAGNGFGGLQVQSAGAENSVLNAYRCLVAHNTGNGLRPLKGGTGAVIARIANSAVIENSGTGLDQAGTAILESLGNSLVRGNNPDVSGTIMIVPGQ